MEYLVIGGAAAGAALLTLFSGFGLGTILMPVFAIFFDVSVAVALTAVVHLFNNLFKLLLLGRHARWHIVARFGVPAVLAAFGGASLLVWLAGQPPLWEYTIAGMSAAITTLKLVIAGLMLGFAWYELAPSARAMTPAWLPVGGVISGFFGGLSGHQGALRSAFLLRCALDQKSYIATGVVIACLVDLIRIQIYGLGLPAAVLVQAQAPLMLTAIGCAFAGSFLGSRLLHKITMPTIRKLVAALLVGLAMSLGIGVV